MSQFLRFLLTGGCAALVNIGSRYVLNLFMPFEVAVIVAYLIAMVVAYVLARKFVFEGSGAGLATESVRFALVNLAAICIVWITSVGLARVVFPAVGFTWYADDIAHAIGVALPAFTSYLGHKYFTFGGRSV
ncbi:MAG: GtrA family protein [Pseudomonadota bacterium]